MKKEESTGFEFGDEEEKTMGSTTSSEPFDFDDI